MLESACAAASPTPAASTPSMLLVPHLLQDEEEAAMLLVPHPLQILLHQPAAPDAALAPAALQMPNFVNSSLAMRAVRVEQTPWH